MLLQNWKMMGMKENLIAFLEVMPPPLCPSTCWIPSEALQGRQGSSGGDQGDGPCSPSIPLLQPWLSCLPQGVQPPRIPLSCEGTVTVSSDKPGCDPKVQGWDPSTTALAAANSLGLPQSTSFHPVTCWYKSPERLFSPTLSPQEKKKKNLK